MSWLIFCLLVVVGIVGVRADWDIRQHLGTHTPYWSEGSTVSTPVPEGCSVVHLNLLSRHGSRYPTSGDVKSLTNLASKLKKYNAYINDSYPYIKNWTNPYSLNQEGFLSFSGQQELFLMGQRFNSTYFPLFSESYFPDVYIMQSTQVPRTGVSASAFAQGYLQGEGRIGLANFQPNFIYSDTPSLDILRFFDNCPQYSTAMDNGTISSLEGDKYANKTYPAIADRITQSLGVGAYWNVSLDDLDTMFTACGFEVAVFHKTDGWCALFAPDDISAYEYRDDLENYYEKSYGSAIAYQISAVILQSIVNTMDGVIAKSPAVEKAYLRFSHAEDIIPFASLLGLFKNSYQLTADLSPAQIESRNWTTSVISPFGANFALALYQCSNNTYRVKLTHNEVEYQFPGCNELYCPYTQFKSLYSQALSFNYTKACALPVFVSTPTSVSLIAFSVSLPVAFVAGALLVLIFAIVYFRKTRKMDYGSLASMIE